MRRCPYCKANVEGLVDHCDVCGGFLFGAEGFLLLSARPDQNTHSLERYIEDFRIQFCASHPAYLYGEGLWYVAVDVFCSDYPVREKVFFERRRRLSEAYVAVDKAEYVKGNFEERRRLAAFAVAKGIRMATAGKKFDGARAVADFLRSVGYPEE